MTDKYPLIDRNEYLVQEFEDNSGETFNVTCRSLMGSAGNRWEVAVSPASSLDFYGVTLTLNFQKELSIDEVMKTSAIDDCILSLMKWSKSYPDMFFKDPS